MAGWQFWIDRGGTFTDVVAQAPDGQLLTRKLLSDNPEHYQDAALQAICDILQMAPGMRLDQAIDSIKMGTTVGTNALLERRGAAVALLINKGFGDCLRIGYQNRPDIFALNIRRPEQLYQSVVEIDVRVDANGAVLHALDSEAVVRQLRDVFNQGVRSVAIVLMHAWRYPEQELALAEIARQVGFTQISLSHQVSPLPKLVSRGDTTVIDAYLSPVLSRYVEQVSSGLSGSGKCPRLFFMQSNGGLVKAEAFRGKDCILSGPAGGMVGAIEVARRAGLDKIIAFDMGGTSTDVAHFAGELERSFDTELAGVRITTPMMAIHTVAAGGGSILHFDGVRYRVGPDSAGANPGPACYRRGGPLTVTDANLLLGKLPSFPAVFGPTGNLPPDLDRVQTLFNELAEHIHTATGDRRGPAQVAAGFLAIAIEHMAEAIKKISVQKGYHLGDYTLCCYGAAGAQHACLLAECLGMSNVLLHPLAGVLSAFGMGLADFRDMRQLAVEQLCEQIDMQELRQQLLTLDHQAKTALIEQGLSDLSFASDWRLALRYQGTDTALTVDFCDSMEQIIDCFAAKYRQQFGFCYQYRSVLVAALQVEAIASVPSIDTVISSNQCQSSQTRGTTRIFSRDSWQDAPILQRDQLVVGQTVKGPAIVLEPHSTIVIEAGWQAHMRHNHDLLLSRDQPRSNNTSSPIEAASPELTAVDPVLLEIFNKRFMSIAEQMGFVLQNTAHSVNIKERLDFSCALFDAECNLVANAPHIPVHLGSMGESVKALLSEHGSRWQPGDAYLLNSPYAGGTHLPDITVVTPVFSADKQLLFFVASRGHHADVGGILPGSMPANSRHIDDEGIISSGLKILAGGEFQERTVRDWLNSNPHPARNPEQNVADLQAQIAANHKGAQELLTLVATYTQPVVQAYMRYVQDHAETCVRAILPTLKDGRFEYPLDQGAKIVVTVTIDYQRQRACIDFTGTTSQLDGNFNAPAAVCKAAVLYVFRTLLKDDIPLNAGCLKPLEIVIPENCLLNPHYPAAVVAGNVETSQYIVDALYGALGIVAGSQGTMNNLTFGNQRYQYYETICGGAGAGDGFAGASGVHTHMTNSRITDPEILEQRFPVLLKTFALRTGSGGDGRYRGGDGVIRHLIFREPMQASILSSHRLLPNFGLAGGSPGELGRNRYLCADAREFELDGCCEIALQSGDALIIETPGGGGFGRVS